jgi:hypothetical protein
VSSGVGEGLESVSVYGPPGKAGKAGQQVISVVPEHSASLSIHLAAPEHPADSILVDVILPGFLDSSNPSPTTTTTSHHDSRDSRTSTYLRTPANDLLKCCLYAG